jgi:hypothetical protein
MRNRLIDLWRGEASHARAGAIDVPDSVLGEIAERTGVSINTLMAGKRRAVRKLAAALEYWMED